MDTTDTGLIRTDQGTRVDRDRDRPSLLELLERIEDLEQRLAALEKRPPVA